MDQSICKIKAKKDTQINFICVPKPTVACVEKIERNKAWAS